MFEFSSEMYLNETIYLEDACYERGMRTAVMIRKGSDLRNGRSISTDGRRKSHNRRQAYSAGFVEEVK